MSPSGRTGTFSPAGPSGSALRVILPWSLEIWQRILEFCDSHTGYTHQWRQPWAQGLRGICQASCDGFADYMAASDATALLPGGLACDRT